MMMSDETKNDAPEAATDQPEDNLPKNTVEVEDAGTLKKKITVTVYRDKIDAKRDEMFGELGTSAQVPGFRIGRAPKRLLEKRFGKEVSQDVRNSLIGESVGEAIKETELKTLGEPDIKLDEIELPDTGDLSFSFEVEVAPEFDLPKLKGIPVNKPARAGPPGTPGWSGGRAWGGVLGGGGRGPHGDEAVAGEEPLSLG